MEWKLDENRNFFDVAWLILGVTSTFCYDDVSWCMEFKILRPDLIWKVTHTQGIQAPVVHSWVIRVIQNPPAKQGRNSESCFWLFTQPILFYGSSKKSENFQRHYLLTMGLVNFCYFCTSPKKAWEKESKYFFGTWPTLMDVLIFNLVPFSFILMFLVKKSRLAAMLAKSPPTMAARWMTCVGRCFWNCKKNIACVFSDQSFMMPLLLCPSRQLCKFRLLQHHHHFP